MKKYETPEYEIEKFTIESIMTDSGLNGDFSFCILSIVFLHRRGDHWSPKSGDW